MLLVLSEIVLPLLVSFVLGWVVMGWLTWSWRRIPVPEIEWRKLQRRAEQAESELEALRVERRALASQLEELLRIRVLAMEALTTAGHDVSRLEQEVVAREERIGVLEAELEAAPPLEPESVPESESAEASATATTAELARLQAELAELQAWTTELEEEYGAMDAELAAVTSRLAQAEARLGESSVAPDGPAGLRNENGIGPAEQHRPLASGPVTPAGEASKAA